ncbi:MAG: hypothetical protein JOZ91_01420 [Candidatus Eremiobacteraeota bacterium]|nr:hypothetical protein [Candidatus Eremiobacteraeota bacterium]MBV8204248.1 hypothetical protein [Candidatus Eremiobacteraeota bacterium]MBV8263577.1 hypothetical protein [Candidatus Eremiobacteraeota bacterium]MBV8339059.1 hypothetical protein [Candidatus Eremiobacteraeota bacterium]MBV8595122.1 hypothetical protein [Candidatus Eremiobacteraeota bacterium]
MRSRTLGYVGLMLAIAFVAAACIATTQTRTLADTSNDPTSCGTIDLATSSSADAARAFNCFSAAFTSCRQATLYANGHDDAGLPTAYTFATVDGGDDHGCSISELVEKQSGTQKTTDSYLCRTVGKDKDGALVFGGCGAQKDVALRLSASGSPSSATASAAPH